jgi:Fe-S-cluster-containing dehydrogenase component
MEDTRWFDVYDLDYKTKNIIKMYQEQVDPKDPSKIDFAFIKRQCMHCKSAGCVSACPVSAMIKNPDTGIVEYHKERCIGCRYCQMACPFFVPKFEWERAIPKITKCELCRETNLETRGLPACCDVCPTKAVIYGKRNELLAVAKQRLEENPSAYNGKIYGERDYGGTNVLYLARVDFNKLGMPDLPDYSFADKSEKVQHTIYKWFAAPIALYTVLAVVAVRNQKKRREEDEKGGHK